MEFQNVINELLKQDLDGPIDLSLLEYTGKIMDIELALDITDDDEFELIYSVDFIHDDGGSPTREKMFKLLI